MRSSTTPLILALGLALAAEPSAAPAVTVTSPQEAQAAGTIVIRMHGVGSAQSGMAKLFDSPDKSLVIFVLLEHAGPLETPALYHGTCAHLGAVANAMTTLSGGKSQSVVHGPHVGTLRHAAYAIAVHPPLSTTIVSCGNVGIDAQPASETETSGFAHEGGTR